jgi:hypothetical protein
MPAEAGEQIRPRVSIGHELAYAHRLILFSAYCDLDWRQPLLLIEVAETNADTVIVSDGAKAIRVVLHV